MTVNVEFNVDQALAKLGELVQAHGPQAVNLAAEVVRVNAVGQLVTGITCGVLGLGFGIAAAIGLRVALKESAKGYREANEGVGIVATMTAIFGGFATFGLLIAALVNLSDVWLWVGLYNPKLALAHAVILRIGGG